jgi:8-oxo-dGTP diphosphatase
MKDESQVSLNIKRARISTGLSQKELAKKLGVSDKTVSAYETGRAVPPTSVLTKISTITGKSLSELLGLKKNDKDNEISKKLDSIEMQLTQKTKEEQLTPRKKVDTFIGVVLLDKQNRIYLIKEEDKYRISLGRWNLPGGSVDNDENLIESAKREAKEETGYNSKINSLLGCYKCKKGKNTWIYIVFKAKSIGKSGKRIDVGVKKGKWFSRQEFLKLDKTKIVHPDMKLVYKTALKNKGLSAVNVKYIDYDLQ